MPRVAIDLSGQRFGRLKVKKRHSQVYDRHGVKWDCECDCGQSVIVYGHHLTQNRTQSCGCQKIENARSLAQNNVTHGMYGTQEYTSWQAMLTRCGNPNHVAFDRYGGRGIVVCERWRSFENFFADMGPKPGPLHSIERGDNDRGYEPGNCYWATPQEQQRNTSRTLLYEYGNRRLSQSELAQELGIAVTTLRRRLGESPTLNGLVSRVN